MRTDEELMRAFVAGDVHALDALYRRYRPMLLASLARWSRNGADAEDVLQQTFVRVHRFRHTYRDGEPVRPWVFAIAHNTRRDAGRAASRRPETMLDADLLASVSDTLGAIEARESVTILRRALATLSPALRTALELHWLEERDFGEVSALTGVREGTLRVRAHRACHVIREFFSTLERLEERAA